MNPLSQHIDWAGGQHWSMAELLFIQHEKTNWSMGCICAWTLPGLLVEAVDSEMVDF